MGGFSLEVNGVRAQLLFVSSSQINFVVPPDTPTGDASVTVKNNGEIDTTFGEGGLWNATLTNGANEMTFSTVVDPAGRIVLGGYSDDGSGLRRLAVARISDRGQLDASFGPDGKGYVILDGYGADVTYRYGPRAAASKGQSVTKASRPTTAQPPTATTPPRTRSTSDPTRPRPRSQIRSR